MIKAAARKIIDNSALDIPAYALGDQELWTHKEVKAALVQAYDVYRDTIGRVGPRGAKAFWPDYAKDWGDLIEQAETGDKEAPRHRRRRSSIDIERADMALLGWTDSKGIRHAPWLNGELMAYERARKCLVAWVMCKHHGVTEKALCERTGWALATFKRHKDFAAGKIAHGLNLSKVVVWR